MFSPFSPPLLSPGTLHRCHSLAQCSLHCQRNQSPAPAKRSIEGRDQENERKEKEEDGRGKGWRGRKEGKKRGELEDMGVTTKVKGGIEFAC